jgi:hypothetical protein
MALDGWLILDIALGILVGDVLREMRKDTQEWWSSRLTRGSKVVDAKAADEHVDETTAMEKATEDWNFLWDNVPESAKEEVRKFVEDEQLRKQAQELNLFKFLWYAASEETKDQLRFRWKLEKIPPRVSE